jgi:nitroimidazol reductase NimA-like FMN-containing flavoprotein (pyridoxamine 5'-phosphate oxidase superfamily)
MLDMSQREGLARAVWSLDLVVIPEHSEGARMDEQIRKKILALLDEHRIMTLATLRPDGWPQATTVGYVNEGLTLYFLCGRDSQKAANLARDNRVSVTIDHDTADLMAITGLSMAARATAVSDREEAAKVLRMLPLKYPEQIALPVPMPTPDDVSIFRLTPTVISVLDYSKGFGHTDLVAC